jgi:hypothetical protein
MCLCVNPDDFVDIRFIKYLIVMKINLDPEGYGNLRGLDGSGNFRGLGGYSDNIAFIFINSPRDTVRLILSYGGTNMQLRVL